MNDDDDDDNFLDSHFMLNHHYHFGNKAHKCHLPGHNLFPMSMMKEMSQFVPGKHKHTHPHSIHIDGNDTNPNSSG